MSAAGNSLSGDSVWVGQDVSPDAIEAAVRDLLAERHAESDGVAPGRALNMIAFVEKAWSGEVANRMRAVGRYHASRLLVLAYDPDRERLDARVSIAPVQPGPGEMAVLRETIVVEIGEAHLDDLVTIADPLVVSDMPTVLWSPHDHPEAIDALLPLAQAVLLDSVDEPDCHEAIERALQLAQRAYVVDLAWLRSTPWRERIANAFDPPHLRGELTQISHVEMTHHPDSTVVCLLLAGWLSARLHWKVGRFLAHNGSLQGKARAHKGEVALNMRCAPAQQERGLAEVSLTTSSGRSVSFQRGPGGLHTRRSMPGSPERQWTILGASRGEGGILGEGIRQALLRDPTYQPALHAAAEMAP
ncbi:MAG: glucose-6-phosphate dehydrogenase assembly protein OpcA [Solirubrobacteraceae bacterium]